MNWNGLDLVSIGVTSTTTGGLMPFNDLAGIILTFGESLQGLSTFIAAATYIAGVATIAHGVFKLRMMADYRTQMSQPMELGGPLISIIVGGMLIWSNTLLDSVTMTIWGSTSPLDYSPNFTGDFQEVWGVILQIVQIVGFIAFVRGWYYLTKLGQQGQPGMLGKALTHIVGGTLAFHMGATLNVLMTTFGFNWT